MERTETFTDLTDLVGLPKNSLERRQAAPGDLVANPATGSQMDYLPSGNIIYRLNKDGSNPVNLRVNYSRSLARPSLRELTRVFLFDYEFRVNVLGNPELKITKISNYDLRLERYFENGDNASVSLFYKDFTNHIEFGEVAGFFSWRNVENSFAYGIELQGKKRLMKNLELRANVSFIKSQTEQIDSVSRTMFGQAPYIINGILTYEIEKIGAATALSYNIQGPKLSIVNNTDGPDVFELPRHNLDFKLSKSLGQYFDLSIKARNILNAVVRRSYDYEEGWMIDYDSFRWGTTYTFGVSYKL